MNGADALFAGTTWHFEGNSTAEGTYIDLVTFVNWYEPDALAPLQSAEPHRPRDTESLVLGGLQQAHQQHLERIREGRMAYFLARGR